MIFIARLAAGMRRHTCAAMAPRAKRTNAASSPDLEVINRSLRVAGLKLPAARGDGVQRSAGVRNPIGHGVVIDWRICANECVSDSV